MSATRKQSSGRYAAVMKVMNTYHRWYCRSAKRARQLEKTVLPRVVRDYDPGTDVFEIGPGPG
jgi:hypothetical protein